MKKRQHHNSQGKNKLYTQGIQLCKNKALDQKQRNNKKTSKYFYTGNHEDNV